MIKASLKLAVRNRQVARSLMEAVEPDNRVPYLKITGTTKPGFLIFGFEFDGGVETFIFTLDDMLRCLQAAIETLDTIGKEN